MATAGSQFQKYRTKGDELTDEYFNIRWQDVDLRLVSLENAMDAVNLQTDELVQRGLTLLHDELSSIISSLNARVNDAQAAVDAVNAALAAVQEAFDTIIE